MSDVVMLDILDVGEHRHRGGLRGGRWASGIALNGIRIFPPNGAPAGVSFTPRPCRCPRSDHGPPGRCPRQPGGRPGGPAERALELAACPQGFPLPSQVPDPVPRGGQLGVEGGTGTGWRPRGGAHPGRWGGAHGAEPLACCPPPRLWTMWATRPRAAWPASAPAPSTSSRCAATPSASTAPKRPASGATGATPRPPPPHAVVSPPAVPRAPSPAPPPHPRVRPWPCAEAAACPAPGFLAKEPIWSSDFPAGSQKATRFPTSSPPYSWGCPLFPPPPWWWP